MGKIKFKRQYQPVKFGDRPSTKTVDGRRIAAIRTAEERRFEQLVRERIEEEFECGSWKRRCWRWVAAAAFTVSPEPKIWDAIMGRELMKLRGNSVAWSPDGTDQHGGMMAMRNEVLCANPPHDQDPAEYRLLGMKRRR